MNIKMKQEVFYKLDNGVRIVMSEAKSHVSYIGLFINAGSRDESRENLGAMHLIEHLLFKGTKSRKYFELMNYIESVGGDMNAYTSKEETCIYISIQNHFLERAIDVLSDIFYNSEFLQIEFDKEREVVLDEINSYKDSPNELIFDEFEELFFDNHQLASNILGTEESLQNMKLSDLQEEYESHYVPSKLIVSYVGGVKLVEVEKLLRYYFEINSYSKKSSNVREACNKTNFFTTKTKRDTFQAHCMLGSKAPSMYDDYKTAMVLLNNLIGGSSFNSLLNFSLREEKGLTYNIESNYTAYADIGVFNVYFGTDNSKVDFCKDVIFSIFLDLANNGLPVEKLEIYKQQLIGQVAISFDNYISLLISNAKSYISYEKVDSYEEVIRKIQKVSNEDIIHLSKQVLMPDTLSTLLYL